MKKLKTVLSVLLSLLLAAGLMTAAFAADGSDIILSGQAGEGVTWTLTDDGVLTVSGEGPITDDIEKEIDEDGSTSITSLTSISTTLYDHYVELCEGKNTEESLRILFDFLKEIVIEEGITAIPEEEFESFFPRKVTTPSTLTEIGYHAFDASFAEEVIIKSASIPHAQFRVSAYNKDAEPYGSIDEAIEGYIEWNLKHEVFQDKLFVFDSLKNIYSIKNDLYETSEEELRETIDYYNYKFGLNAGDLDELIAPMIERLNADFGTNFDSLDEIFHPEEDEWGYVSAVAETELQTIVDEEIDRESSNDRLETLTVGEESLDLVAYKWLKVTIPAGSELKESFDLTGISVTTPDGTDPDADLCKLCHKDHSGNFLQKIVGAFHKVIYFFAHLLRIM